jgi:hypothetical protein
MLTQEVTNRLSAADRAFQQQLALRFVLRTLKYVAAFLLALFAADVAFHLGANSRVTLAAVYAGIVAAVMGWAFYVARVRRNSLEKIARILENRDESLGSKLINILQLSRQIDTAEQPPLTRQLAERALTDSSKALADVDFKPLTKSPTLKRDLKFAVGAGAITLGLLVAFFPISKLELLRFADPFGDHPPYSLTQLEITEPSADGAAVTYDRGALFKVKTSGHKPDELFLSFYDPAKPGAVSTVPMYNKGELGFYQQIDNIKSDLFVFAHTKSQHSISTKRFVSVTLTPKVEKAFVAIAPPAYTGLKPGETGFEFKNVRALDGSRIKFRIQSNRPLASGSIDLQTESGALSQTVMAPSATNEVSGEVTASDSGRMKFSLTDVAQNASQENLSASLTVTHDLPPDIVIESPPNDSFVCEDVKLEAHIVASDDCGLKTIRIHRALNEVYSQPKTISFDQIVRNTREVVMFDIKSLGVQPGDTIALFAEAVDTCPDPHLARSKTVHFMVISTDEYNDFLRERSDISDIEGKYAQLLNEFHDLLDQQKEISDKIKELQNKLAKGDEAAKKALQQELDKHLAKQAELNHKLADLAQRMEKFVRDKPLYDIESDIQNVLSQKAAEIKSSLDESNQAVKDAVESLAANENNQEKRLQALAALREQSDRQLKKLGQVQQEAKDEIIPPLEDAELMNALINDFNHFKYLYEQQTAAAEQTKAYETKKQLIDADKLALKQLAGAEKQIEQALAKTIENLRQHANEAEKTFPKAAESARDLADMMETQQLAPLAKHAANTMLTGNGEDSYQSAEHLRQEMANFFEDFEPRMGKMCKEMDQHLKLQRQLGAGNTFKQMMQGRKFGRGMGFGQGDDGMGGNDGYAVSSGNNFGVLGNETITGNPKDSSSGGHAKPGASSPGQKVDLDKADSMKGMQPSNRQTGDVRTETPIEQYRDVVDAYFNSITK